MPNALDEIRKSLSHISLKWKPTEWLDTGIADLHRVLGHEKKGIPYGHLIEISGWESQGKSALMMALAALAQRDGALIIWLDIENSFKPDWARQRGFKLCPHCNGAGLIYADPKKKKKSEAKACAACGGIEYDDEGVPFESPTCGLDTEQLILIQKYVGRFTYKDKKGKIHQEKEHRLSSAQDLCKEAEIAMSMTKHKKRLLVLDSVAALETEGEILAGFDGSMRTRMDLPIFMSLLCKRWTGRAQVHNVLMIFVNQLRESPGMQFGDPTYTTGGNAARFYYHARVRVSRVAGSKITEGGIVAGIKGVMTCMKNKIGGVEGSKIGYKLWYKKSIEFVDAKELTAKPADND